MNFEPVSLLSFVYVVWHHHIIELLFFHIIFIAIIPSASFQTLASKSLYCITLHNIWSNKTFICFAVLGRQFSIQGYLKHLQLKILGFGLDWAS